MINTTQKSTGNYGLERFLLNAFRITGLFSSKKLFGGFGCGCAASEWIKYKVAGLC